MLEFPHENRWQAGNANLRIPLDNSDLLAEIVRRAMRGGLPNRLEDASRSPLTPNIRYVRNPPDFKLRSRHMEVLDA